MDIKNLYNPLASFDFSVLDDPEFLEDAVREEIISPILKELGYKASGPNRIIRSRKLLHPFVSIGSVRKEIFIIPDYLLEVNGKNAWVMEAKAPTEQITKSSHVEQTYSYATHSEVLVKHFALCNGKEFALYAIGEANMLILNFEMELLPNYWEDVKKWLLPENVFTCQNRLNKDLGLHLKRLGYDGADMIFPKVMVLYLARMNANLFSFSTTAVIEGSGNYTATFDFDLDRARQLKGLIPEKAFEILMKPVTDSINQVQFAGFTLFLNLRAKIGDKLEENKDEIFLPLEVISFLNL